MLRSTCFFLFFLLPPLARAQHYYETYSPANGLVDARVTKMVQDGSGRIFFLTRDGISIFDGQRIVNHTQVNEKTIGIVNDALVSPDGHVYLATFSGDWLEAGTGLHSLTSDNIFTRQKLSEVSGIVAMADGSQLIVSNHGQFIYRDGKFRQLHDRIHQVPETQKILNKFAVSGGHLIFNYLQYHPNTVYLYNIHQEKITDSLVINGLVGLCPGPGGNLYILTNAGISELTKENIQMGKCVPAEPSFNRSIPRGFMAENLFIDQQKNTWLISTQLGCCRIDATSGEITLFESGERLHPGISQIFQDRENNYWFIAPGKGVQKWMHSNYEGVTRIGAFATDRVYFCNTSDDSSLFLLSATSGIISRKNQVRSIPLGNKIFPDAVFFWQQHFWAFPGPGYLVNNEGEHLVIHPPLNAPAPAHFPSPHVEIDQQGNLLLAGNVFVLVKKNHSNTSLALPYFADNIVAAGNNTYYAFCRSNDIIKCSWQNGKLVKERSFRLDDLGPRYAIHWNKDTFLVASRQRGIAILKINDQSVTLLGRIDRGKGMSNDFVETLLKFNEHQVAAGTASGLDIITLLPNDTLVENISSRVNHFEPILQLARDDQGIIYARTEDYRLYRYQPGSPVLTGYRPKAWFHSIAVNNRVITPVTTSFPYHENNFRFSVASPSFTDNRQIDFQFRLTGSAKSWEQSGNKADFGINNLSPGSYTLAVNCRYPGKIYPDQQLFYHFVIKPPFWSTWWFISLCILGGVGLIFVATRSYYRRRLQKREAILQRQQAVEKERTRIATDMHDDFGASLSRIKFLSEKMQVQQAGNAGLKQDLEKISGFSDEMAEKMGEIVWALNQRYDSAGDLVSFCRSYASEYMEDKPAQLQFHSGIIADTRINGEIRRNIFLVMKEALHNIVKHSGATVVQIEMSCEKVLNMVIADNGQGFDPANVRPFANGLENMRKRVAGIGGTIRIESKEGTRISIQVDPGILQKA